MKRRARARECELSFLRTKETGGMEEEQQRRDHGAQLLRNADEERKRLSSTYWPAMFTEFVWRNSYSWKFQIGTIRASSCSFGFFSDLCWNTRGSWTWFLSSLRIFKFITLCAFLNKEIHGLINPSFLRSWNLAIHKPRIALGESYCNEINSTNILLHADAFRHSPQS